MTPEELARRRDEVQVVDVRWSNEWEAGHIEGAVHIPVDEIDERLDDIDRSRPVVAVCLSGSRSADAAETLAAAGWEAENLDGGMEAWADAGLPLVRDGGEPGEVVEPEEPLEHLQRLEKEFMKVLFEVEEHFGDREPSDEEVRTFLRQRLIDQGRTPEEADALMASVEDGG